MSLDTRQRVFLDKLAEEGPLSDESLSGILGDQASASDAAKVTGPMAEEGFIKESDFAPGRWQITDAGQRTRAQD